jgi:pantoate--beta-alanine ligase
MRAIERLAETAERCDRYRAAALSVGFVPTLGALHDGHVSLFRRAKSECDRVAVSIFVNPTQFGPGEDLAAYPRPREADLAACREAGVDLVFLGAAGEMYPAGFQTWVTVDELSRPLCGASRPVHFRGVATVVTQLLSIVRPHRAYFGQKDYQQSLVVRRLALDLHLGAEIRVLPTVREADGLAMSSRNRYLDAGARRVAPRIARALAGARELILGGEEHVEAVVARLRSDLEREGGLRIDYAEVLEAATLRAFEGGLLRRGPGGIVVAVAAHVGGARLIDNVVIAPGPG